MPYVLPSAPYRRPILYGPFRVTYLPLVRKQSYAFTITFTYG